MYMYKLEKKRTWWRGPVQLSPERLQSSCLKSTYFSYDGEFYEQRQGAAMGSPVSAVKFIEELTIESAPSRSRLWKWYVWVAHAA